MLPERYQDRNQPMAQLRRELDRLFEGFFSTWPGMGLEMPDFVRSGLTETDDGYELELEMPGFDAEEVKVDLKGDVLTIRAEREDRRIERSLSLPEAVDADLITAKLERGILVVTLPHSPEIAARSIEVQSGKPKTKTVPTAQPQTGQAPKKAVG